MQIIRRAVSGAGVSALVVAAGTVLGSPTARAASLPSNCTQASAGGKVTCTFSYTGSEQKFVVPSDASTVSVQVTGGSGAPSPVPQLAASYPVATGGLGAVVSGNFAVKPGATLYVEVGGEASGTQGGWNGGGDGGTASTPAQAQGPVDPGGGGGGGASDIRTVSAASTGSLGSRLVVAGGGGGGGAAAETDSGPGGANNLPGGNGGNAGAAGSNAPDNGYDPSGNGGGAGSSAAGGTGGTGGTAADQASHPGNDGNPGTKGVGGAGAGLYSDAGGGGGGYYGGGGGGGGATDSDFVFAGNAGGGGGGSSYLAPSVTGAALHSSATSPAALASTPGPGRVIISYTPTVAVTTTTTVAPATTTVATTTTVAPTTTTAPHSSPQLANTGARDVGPLVGEGVASMSIGGVLVLAARRRYRGRHLRR